MTNDEAQCVVCGDPVTDNAEYCDICQNYDEIPLWESIERMN